MLPGRERRMPRTSHAADRAGFHDGTDRDRLAVGGVDPTAHRGIDRQIGDRDHEFAGTWRRTGSVVSSQLDSADRPNGRAARRIWWLIAFIG